MHSARLIATLVLGTIAAGPSFADDAVPASAADPEPAAAQTAAPAPRWRAAGTIDSDGYRMSLSRGAVDVGMRFEPRSVSATPAPAGNLAARAVGTARDAETTSVSKVGIEWKPAQSQVFFSGGVG